MLTDEVEAPAPLPFVPVETAPGAAAMQELEHLLSQATRPFAILGGGGWSEQAAADFTKAAERWSLPVGVEFRRQMLFDHLHPGYAGDVGIGPNPKLAEAIRWADLVLLVGGRFPEVPSSNYTLLQSPYPAQKLVHVHADPQELGRVYRPTLPINASPAAFAAAFAETAPPAAPRWGNRTEELHQAYLAWSTPPEIGPGEVQMGPIMAHLETALAPDTIFCNGAGHFATWIHRFHRFRGFAT